MKILIGGGSGFVGRYLTDYFKSLNYEVWWVSRKAGPQSLPWNLEVLSQKIGDFDAVINLTGENLFAKRWSATQMQVLRESRVSATQTLIKAMAQSNKRPGVYVNASAIGYYGSQDSDENYTEETPAGKDGLARLCVDWEEAAFQAQKLGIRTAVIRIGVVLGHGGGALEEMVKPFKFFMGGYQGSGKQLLSWIHLKDLARIFQKCLEDTSFQGIYNATAVHPATNQQVCQQIGKILKKPCWLPVPAWLLKIVLGGVSVLIVNGQRVVPKRLLDQNFEFEFMQVQEALGNLLEEEIA